jgi:hypothetical protein
VTLGQFLNQRSCSLLIYKVGFIYHTSFQGLLRGSNGTMVAKMHSRGGRV